MNNMLNDFINFIEENRLCNKNDRILLGVSGGIDSMAMARLFVSAGYDIAIAHCNFCLRGNESDEDEMLVCKTASEYNVPFFTRRFETSSHAREYGISIQMAARDLRYEWFESTRSENNFDLIAIAHNLNDNVETFLINLIRGTGLKGLSGMKPFSNRIIRPLLFATRQRIEEYCKQEKIPFREDKSNAEVKYTRNKIRHILIPMMKEINPSIETTLNETAKRLTETGEIAARYLTMVEKDVFTEDGETIILKIDPLMSMAGNSTLIFELLKPYGVTGPLVNDLINIMRGTSGGRVITDSHSIIRDREELIISPLWKGLSEIHCEINNTDELSIAKGIEFAEVIPVTSGLIINDTSKIAFLDFEKISFPLLIRNWRKGDSFIPLGMSHSKKLSDYFIDNKFSLIKKENTLILESGDKIAWIIGERIDERFKITSSTTKILKIKAK
ncbi:MAG: tRNA lysidine(34) synthetase TilS [Bacteroidales bacterium]|nr:tRNA lysidine(34) synthetase TilS [Bacteroidales bacterium]